MRRNKSSTPIAKKHWQHNHWLYILFKKINNSFHCYSTPTQYFQNYSLEKFLQIKELLFWVNQCLLNGTLARLHLARQMKLSSLGLLLWYSRWKITSSKTLVSIFLKSITSEDKNNLIVIIIYAWFTLVSYLLTNTWMENL